MATQVKSWIDELLDGKSIRFKFYDDLYVIYFSSDDNPLLQKWISEEKNTIKFKLNVREINAICLGEYEYS